MIDVPINNKEILATLKKFEWYYENREHISKYLRKNGRKEHREHFVCDEYRDKIIAEDTKHEGFPEDSYSYSLKEDQLYQKLGDRRQPDHGKEMVKILAKYGELNTELCTLLSTRNNALQIMYPPDGFIAWHNNANASAYNLIFSWSETGDGDFRYVDGHTGKMVVMKDKKGWQCKAGYFGAYGEPWYNRVYHAAQTNCWRVTVSYVFDRTDIAHGLQDEIIEEIMSDY